MIIFGRIPSNFIDLQGDSLWASQVALKMQYGLSREKACIEVAQNWANSPHMYHVCDPEILQFLGTEFQDRVLFSDESGEIQRICDSDSIVEKMYSTGMGSALLGFA